MSVGGRYTEDERIGDTPPGTESAPDPGNAEDPLAVAVRLQATGRFEEARAVLATFASAPKAATGIAIDRNIEMNRIISANSQDGLGPFRGHVQHVIVAEASR